MLDVFVNNIVNYMKNFLNNIVNYIDGFMKNVSNFKSFVYTININYFGLNFVIFSLIMLSIIFLFFYSYFYELNNLLDLFLFKLSTYMPEEGFSLANFLAMMQNNI